MSPVQKIRHISQKTRIGHLPFCLEPNRVGAPGKRNPKPKPTAAPENGAAEDEARARLKLQMEMGCLENTGL